MHEYLFINYFKNSYNLKIILSTLNNFKDKIVNFIKRIRLQYSDYLWDKSPYSHDNIFYHIIYYLLT